MVPATPTQRPMTCIKFYQFQLSGIPLTSDVLFRKYIHKIDILYRIDRLQQIICLSYYMYILIYIYIYFRESDLPPLTLCACDCFLPAEESISANHVKGCFSQKKQLRKNSFQACQSNLGQIGVPLVVKKKMAVECTACGYCTTSLAAQKVLRGRQTLDYTKKEQKKYAGLFLASC